MHYPNLSTTALDQREPLQKTKGLFLDCQIKIFFNSNIYTLIPAYFLPGTLLPAFEPLFGRASNHPFYLCIFFFLLGALNQTPQKVI